MGRAKAQLIAVGVAVGVLVLGLVASVMLLAPQRTIKQAAGGSLHLVAFDVAGTDGYTIEQLRALKSAVFVGRVVEQDGDVDIGDAGSPFLLPIYAVDVETSLKGEAQGRVKVAVTELGAADEYGGDVVTVGERYLFAAEGPEEGKYWVDEGLGSLRIDNDNEAAAITAQYQQLIEDVDDVPVPEPEEDPCNDLAGNPTIDIDPNQGKAGRTIRVTAKRVAGPEVVVYWRNHNDRAGRGDVRGDCTANVRIKVPNDARPGRYDVIVQDSSDKEASERFHVID